MTLTNYCVAPLTKKIQKFMIVYFGKVHAIMLFFFFTLRNLISCVCFKQSNWFVNIVWDWAYATTITNFILTEEEKHLDCFSPQVLDHVISDRACLGKNGGSFLVFILLVDQHIVMQSYSI